MDFIRTATLFVLEPVWKGAKELVQLLLFMTPLAALVGVVCWIFKE